MNRFVAIDLAHGKDETVYVYRDAQGEIHVLERVKAGAKQPSGDELEAKVQGYKSS